MRRKGGLVWYHSIGIGKAYISAILELHLMEPHSLNLTNRFQPWSDFCDSWLNQAALRYKFDGLKTDYLCPQKATFIPSGLLTLWIIQKNILYVAVCWHSAITVIADCKHSWTMVDQRSAVWFDLTVMKIEHTLKPVFYNSKSEGPFKKAKNIAEI